MTTDVTITIFDLVGCAAVGASHQVTLDFTCVGMRGLHHVLEHWVEELACFLGITAGQQLNLA